MPSLWTFELPAILLGLLLGSFLNVCISRLPGRQSIIQPRSRCESCGHPIRPFDNLPVLSWLLLRGRCRNCGSAISWRYPAVELATAAWFTLIAWQLRAAYALPPGAADRFATAHVTAAQMAIFGFLLIGLMVMDAQTQRLPDAFTLTGALLGFILTCVQSAYLALGEGDVHFNPQNNLRLDSPGSFQSRGDVFLTGTEALVLGRLVAVLAAFCLMLTIRALYRRLRHREGMGLGDAKLLAMLAAFLGFFPALLCLMVASVLGSLYAVPLLLTGRARAATRLPFGVFLSLSGLLVAVVGGPVAQWYLGLLR